MWDPKTPLHITFTMAQSVGNNTYSFPYCSICLTLFTSQSPLLLDSTSTSKHHKILFANQTKAQHHFNFNFIQHYLFWDDQIKCDLPQSDSLSFISTFQQFNSKHILRICKYDFQSTIISKFSYSSQPCHNSAAIKFCVPTFIHA